MTPIGSQITLQQLDDSPYRLFDQLRHAEPVSWIDAIGMWAITRRNDIRSVLTDREAFTVVSEDSRMLAALGRNMLTADGAEHLRLRKPFVVPFAATEPLNAAGDLCADIAARLLDRLAPQGSADLKAEFADPLATETIVAYMGLPRERSAEIHGWITDFGAVMSDYSDTPAVRQQGQQAHQALAVCIRRRLAILQEHSDGSVLSQVLHAAENDLSEAELIDSTAVILFGAIETTAALIANALWLLLSHPDQLARLRSGVPVELDGGKLHPILFNAIHEALRFESPVQTCTRHVTRPTLLREVSLGEGQTVECLLGSANRDPAHFTNPDHFDITRTNAKEHYAFGTGRHTCIGAKLASIEAQIALRLVFERLPTLTLESADDSRPRGHEFRSPSTLRVRW